MAYRPRLTRDLENRFPPVGHFMSLQGSRIHYLDEGPHDAPALVMIHGASGNLQDFQQSLMPALRDRYRVIAIDRHGHGYSDRLPGPWAGPDRQATLILQLLQSLNISEATILGHSWAGSVVLAFALAYPQHTRAAILLAAASQPWTTGVSWYNALAGIPFLGKAFAAALVGPVGKRLLPDAVREVFAPEAVPDNYTERTAAPLALRPKCFLNNAEDMRELSPFLEQQRHAYSNIKTPVLMLTGLADHLVPNWNHADRLERQIPHSQRVNFPGAGHAFHHTRTTEVAMEIDKFLAPLPYNRSAVLQSEYRDESTTEETAPASLALPSS